MTKEDSTNSEVSKALVRKYFQKLLNEKDLSACDEMLSSDYKDSDASPDIGPQNTKKFVAKFLEDYPDMQVDIKDMLAEGNKVAVRIEWCGNHRVSGEKFHQMGIVILRLNDKGQLAERWSAYKPLLDD